MYVCMYAGGQSFMSDMMPKHIYACMYVCMYAGGQSFMSDMMPKVKELR